MAITETVYKTHGNENIVTIASSISATPLVAVTRITVELSDGVVVDSDVDVGAISWTDTQITLAFGGVSSSGLRSAIITAFSVAYPTGQVIVHPQGDSDARVTFKFIEN